MARGRRRAPIAGRAVALGLALAVALAACAEPGVTLDGDLESLAASPPPSAAGPSGTPIPSERPSTTASASPMPTATTGASGLAVDGLLEVIVTDLVVRTAPGVDPGRSAILPGRLTSGDRAFVADGPVPAAGYDWYLVAGLREEDGTAGPFGWVAAASREGDPWVRASEPACPETVDLAGVLALEPLERLACFGGESLTLTAPSIACGAGGGPWTWEPEWLAVLGGCGLSIDAIGAMLYRVPPGVTPPGTATPLTVRGHFDDPAARSCRTTSADPVAYPPPSIEESVLICRTEFVVEE